MNPPDSNNYKLWTKYKSQSFEGIGEEPKAGRDNKYYYLERRKIHLLRSTFIQGTSQCLWAWRMHSSKGAVLLVLGSQDQRSGLSERWTYCTWEVHKEESHRWGGGNIFIQTLKSLANSCTKHVLGENPRNQWKATAGSLKELSQHVNSCLILERQSPSNWEESGKQFEHSIEILEGP